MTGFWNAVRPGKFRPNRHGVDLGVTYKLAATDKETGKVKKKMTIDAFKQVVDVNLTGTFLTLREAYLSDCKIFYQPGRFF